MVFSTKELPKKIRIFLKNPLIFRQKTSLVQSLRLSLSASLGSTFFCLDLDWITNKGLSIRRETANCGGWTPTSTGPVQNGRCEPPNFKPTILQAQKKHTKGVHKMVLRGSHKNMRFCWIGCVLVVLDFVQKLHPPTPLRKTQVSAWSSTFFFAQMKTR